MKLFVFDQWVDTNLSKEPLDFSLDFSGRYCLWDLIMINEIN